MNPGAALAERVRAGEARAIGRAISACENQDAVAADLNAALYGVTGRAEIVGITGAPGAGKSTLVDRLARTARASGRRVGILAVDPTSPFSGGAILGDRVRMQELYLDPGVFIRSMATRGAMGGLARAAGDAVDVLDAAGYDLILVETVGVGQDEVDVVRAVDTVLVLLVPGLGDDIQAIKAGVMEIADVFVVNKADRPGAERTAAEVEAMLSQASEHGAWVPPIVPTVAASGAGIDRLTEAIGRHRQHLQESGDGRRRQRQRLATRFESLLRDELYRRVAERAFGAGRLDSWIDALEGRRVDPHTAVKEILDGVAVRVDR